MTKKQPLEPSVRAFLNKWGVRLNQPIVVGVSGGVDSMTLLTVLSRLGFSPIAVHVNHGLRKTARRDEAAVLEYAEKLSVPVVVKKVNLGKAKTAMEERAREARYKALREVAKEVRAQYVLTAHTADDQVETILFNFLRGASLRGMAGMRESTEAGILRPLLDFTKAELISYAKRHRLSYVEDETNKSKAFTRNRIRLELLPQLRSYNEKVDQQILATGRLMAEAEQALAAEVAAIFAKTASLEKELVVITASKFRELTSFLQGEILKLAVISLGGDLAGLTQAHFDEAVRFVANLTGRVSKKKIGGKLWLQRGYDKITVSKK